jgi:hypothetical protein
MSKTKVIFTLPKTARTEAVKAIQFKYYNVVTYQESIASTIVSQLPASYSAVLDKKSRYLLYVALLNADRKLIDNIFLDIDGSEVEDNTEIPLLGLSGIWSLSPSVKFSFLSGISDCQQLIIKPYQEKNMCSHICYLIDSKGQQYPLQTLSHIISNGSNHITPYHRLYIESGKNSVQDEFISMKGRSLMDIKTDGDKTKFPLIGFDKDFSSIYPSEAFPENLLTVRYFPSLINKLISNFSLNTESLGFYLLEAERDDDTYIEKSFSENQLKEAERYYFDLAKKAKSVQTNVENFQNGAVKLSNFACVFIDREPTNIKWRAFVFESKNSVNISFYQGNLIAYPVKAMFLEPITPTEELKI